MSPELLDELTDADSPRGLLAVARLPRSGVEALPVAPGRPYLYLDGLQDPGNLGALARVAEAAGAAGLALSPGCVHPNHPRALRASAGSLLRLPVAVGVEPGRPRRATSPPSARAGPPSSRATARTSIDAPLDGTLILAVGAEGPGLSPALLAPRRPAADHPDGAGGRVAQRHGGRGAGAVRDAAAALTAARSAYNPGPEPQCVPRRGR